MAAFGRPPNTLILIGALLAAGAAGMTGSAVAQTGPQACGNPFVNHFGPWDYRVAPRDHLANVESNHFTPGVESMTIPKTTAPDKIAGDVGYTLAVFPNHHRALVTMSRLAERHKKDPPPGVGLTVECWFDRAIRFRPDDTIARMLYAQFLFKKGRKTDALHQLKVSDELATDNAFTQFNLGLVYFEMGEFELALAAAHRSRALGLERPELEDKLRAAGKWSAAQ